MIPTKAAALRILEQAKKEDYRHCGWATHAQLVGDTAAIIATKLQEKSCNIDPEKVRVLGYLHDVGKKVGPKMEHPYRGYCFLQALSYDEEYCEISLVHSFVNNDPFCNFADVVNPKRDQFLIDFIRKHKFTLEEKLISLCDQMVTTKVMTIDRRIVDIISRYGVCTRTPDRIKALYQLKAEFDRLLGYNLYDLFPEIKENL